jgi:hypothetical protein
MIGAILVTLLVAVLVVSYMLLVNRMLRTDEHWRETDMVKPAPTTATPRNFSAKMSEARA